MPSRVDYIPMTLEDKINECYRMFAVYVHILKDGYQISEEEIRRGFENIMKGGRPWAARAHAPAATE